MIKITVYFPS